MDTEAITIEIVRIRTRLEEIEEQTDGASGPDIEDEKQRLEERLRDLRGRMSRQGADETHHDSVAEEVRYIPPA